MKSIRYKVAALVIVASVAFSAGAGANVFLLDFAGYDAVWPNDMGEPGSSYWALGDVNAVNSTYLTIDPANNEYTFVLKNAWYVSSDTVGTNIFHTYSAGTFDVYEDPIATGTHRDYGINPANATAPSTFEDGVNILGGDFTGSIVIWIDMMTWNGSVSGNLDFVRGSQLGNIPVDQRNMALTIAGMTFMPPMGPEGYFWQIDGQVFIEEAVPTQKTTWGRLKKLGGGN
jgi:hypothetical protein